MPHLKLRARAALMRALSWSVYDRSISIVRGMSDTGSRTANSSYGRKSYNHQQARLAKTFAGLQQALQGMAVERNRFASTGGYFRIMHVVASTRGQQA